MRNNFMLLLALSALEYTTEPSIVLEFMKEINQQFLNPLPECDIKCTYKSVCKSINKRNSKKNGYYHYSNDKIIELLSVSKEEQQILKTIISKEEKVRRDKLRKKDKRRNFEGDTARQAHKRELFKNK